MDARVQSYRMAAQVVAAKKRKPVDKVEVDHPEMGKVVQWVLSEDDREFVTFAGIWGIAQATKTYIDPQDYYVGMEGETEDTVILSGMSLQERYEKWPLWSDELKSYWPEIVAMRSNIVVEIEKADPVVVEGEVIE